MLTKLLRPVEMVYDLKFGLLGRAPVDQKVKASVQCRPHDRSLGMVMKEVEGDLAIFLEMRKHEKARNDLLLIQQFDAYDDSTESTLDSSAVSDTMFREAVHQTSVADNFLNADSEKSDYDWLFLPPDTPSFPSLEMGMQNAGSQAAISSASSTAHISKPENPPDELCSPNNTSAQPITSTGKHSSASGNRKPLSLGGQKSTLSRSATPTRRSAIPAASKPSRSSTPTSRGIAASNKPVAPALRSSTSTRATARASTPPARSLIPSTSKSTSRSTTPTHKSSITSVTSVSAPSSSVTKTVPTMLKHPGTSRGTSPTMKSWPKKAADMPVSPSDARPNLRMAVPKRPSSVSKGRPTASCSLSSSGVATTGRLRQKSCSPSRRRVNDGALKTGSNVLSKIRGYSNGSDDVNPVLVGTQMVERVVNMRKLAPSKHDNDDSHDNSSGKSSLSQDNSGFGRSLSKKSLDMAIRHMDIRSISGNLKTIGTTASRI